MKLKITVTLDSGGTVTIKGEDLTAEDINEVFAILGGYTVEAVDTEVERQSIDEPLPQPFVPGSVSEEQRTAFVEGFNEGRVPPQEEENT